jgi:hypothetical protein
MRKIFLIIVSCFLMMSAHASLEEIFGNGETGDSCKSDYECQTLCCNNSIGTCSDHNPKGSPSILCSKDYGQSCVSNEFCKATYVTICELVRTTDNSCQIRCRPELINGTCEKFKCTQPRTPPRPPFDPGNPDCSNAVDP